MILARRTDSAGVKRIPTVPALAKPAILCARRPPAFGGNEYRLRLGRRFPRCRPKSRYRIWMRSTCACPAAPLACRRLVPDKRSIVVSIPSDLVGSRSAQARYSELESATVTITPFSCCSSRSLQPFRCLPALFGGAAGLHIHCPLSSAFRAPPWHWLPLTDGPSVRLQAGSVQPHFRACTLSKAFGFCLGLMRLGDLLFRCSERPACVANSRHSIHLIEEQLSSRYVYVPHYKLQSSALVRNHRRSLCNGISDEISGTTGLAYIASHFQRVPSANAKALKEKWKSDHASPLELRVCTDRKAPASPRAGTAVAHVGAFC
jgi:hypothetical protein